MATTIGNVVTRSISRIYRFLGVSSDIELNDIGQNSPADSINYGAFTVDEFRHMMSTAQNPVNTRNNRGRVPQIEDILSYLEGVSNNTRTKIEEIKNLKVVAPEIKVASRVIVSTIMSPVDLQTNYVNITMSYAGIPDETKQLIVKSLNDHFNNEFHLAPRLAEWLLTAGFEEGAKAIIVLPKHELDVQNAIADALKGNEAVKAAAEATARIQQHDESIVPSVEAVAGVSNDVLQRRKNDLELAMNCVGVEAEIALENLGADKYFKDEKFTPAVESTKDGKELYKIATSADLAAKLKEGSFKLLQRSGDETVVVTRDLSHVTKGTKNLTGKLKELLKDAQAQMAGFKVGENGAEITSQVRTLSISENIKLGEGDIPIILEIPSDAVIPVCAPRDNKNHIGYFVLIDENGQPITGRANAFTSGTTDVSNRLALAAATSVYGNATLKTFADLTSSPEYMLKQMTDIFTVAVNKLLESKLGRDGLTGLNINTHSAVGKALFYNLLANNRVRIVFVPEPMMVYYRFDHRDDGTGKAILEDVAPMIALRTTLMVARLMAAIDSSTLHRTIEVDVDESDNNPQQTFELLRREALSKYAPAFSTEVQTAAESLINRNITIKPKSIEGTTDNLSVSIDKSYGNSSSPDQDIMEKLNNWIAMGLDGLPASVLNQLGENEFARSVATTNMFFANHIAGRQLSLRPHNKKFVVNYVSSCDKLVKMITDAVTMDRKNKPDKVEENTSKDTKDDTISRKVKDVIESIDIDLPQPAMTIKKSHLEEISSLIDAVQKVLDIVYSDDVIANDELKGNMNAIRAIIMSSTLREFLPKLGVQAIAEIPDPTHVEADYSKNLTLNLLNLQRRLSNLTKVVKKELPNTAGDNNPVDVGGGEDENNQDDSSSGDNFSF